MVEWSEFPEEIKQEILKSIDLLSRQRLRFCSRKDFETVDTTKVKIGFLKISVATEEFSILTVEDISDSREILRVDLRNLDEKVGIFRSDDLHSDGKLVRFLENVDLLDASGFLLDGFFRNFQEIDALLIENHDLEKDHQILQNILQHVEKMKLVKKLYLSGKMNLKSLQVFRSLKTGSGTEIINRNWFKDRSRKWEDFKEYKGSFKAYEFSKFGNKDKCQEHITACVGIDIVGYMAKVESKNQRKTHWIPGHSVENREYCLKVFGGTFEDHESYSMRKVTRDPERAIFVKFTNCGIVIKVGKAETLMEEFDENKCDLEWMCPVHGTSSEDWFFRETVMNLL